MTNEGADRDAAWGNRSEKEADTSRRRTFVWPLIAIFMTAIAVGHVVSLKRRLLDFNRLGRQAGSTRHAGGAGKSYQYSSWSYTRGSDHKGQDFTHRHQSNYSSFEPDWQSLAEAAERLRRIRLMQEAFLRERERIFQRWQEVDWKQQGQQFGREHWYWEGGGWTNWRAEGQRPRFDYEKGSRKSAQAHQYDVLGLDSKRTEPYTDAEIKAAFRAKAMEYHPDRNQHRKEYAEAKFREVMASYQALKGQNTSTGST